MLSGDCNTCINCILPSYSATCVECGLSRKNYKPQTNADRIRNMSDEELANLFSEIVDCERGCDARKDKCWMTDSTCCLAWLDWLRQEAKE